MLPAILVCMAALGVARLLLLLLLRRGQRRRVPLRQPLPRLLEAVVRLLLLRLLMVAVLWAVRRLLLRRRLQVLEPLLLLLLLHATVAMVPTRWAVLLRMVVGVPRRHVAAKRCTLQLLLVVGRRQGRPLRPPATVAVLLRGVLVRGLQHSMASHSA